MLLIERDLDIMKIILELPRLYISLVLVGVGLTVLGRSSVNAQTQWSSMQSLSQRTKPDSIGGDPLSSEVSGTKYINHFFGFSINYPKGWILVSAPSSSNTRASGAQSLPLGMSDDRVFSLLLTVEPSDTKPRSQWRRLGVLATKLKDPSISIEDHLKAGTELLKQKGSLTQIVGSPERVNLAGKTFWKQRLTRHESGVLFHLDMFAIKKNGYVLHFVVWAASDSEANELEPVIHSLKFIN
jgi:hypothetical protein